MRKIISNKIQCNHCKDIIESKYRHNYVTCSCKRVSCDGGTAYLKRMFMLESDYTELSECLEVEDCNS